MLGGADAELALGALRQLADGDAGHDINDIIAINDCTMEDVVLADVKTGRKTPTKKNRV
jgi:hypothetical protein